MKPNELRDRERLTHEDWLRQHRPVMWVNVAGTAPERDARRKELSNVAKR